MFMQHQQKCLFNITKLYRTFTPKKCIETNQSNSNIHTITIYRDKKLYCKLHILQNIYENIQIFRKKYSKLKLRKG